ncbi:fungal-specific transcription factor domain-containing protein [Hypomontagnella monticulosa]|nr:fungal-specific transcription factor domain-containing protein [Hypomontagnella monticulosa]
MFYTFASTPTASSHPTQRRPRRPKVARACNYCRQHRVRCDAESPCSRCVANNIECVISYPNQRPVVSPEVVQNNYPSKGESISTSTPSTRSRPPSPDVDGSGGIDSAVGFMSKISAFCSGISQLSFESINDSPPPYSCSSGHLSQNVSGGHAVLSKSQVGHLLDIYWIRCHPFNPVLDRPQVDAIFQTLWAPDGSELRSVPVINGIIALCLSYLDKSGLNRRLLGLHYEQGDASLAYFKRCLAATGQSYAMFAEPSLTHLQCYVLMTLYLLDAGEHQPAYNMIGLALRISQTLNLHHGLPDSDPNTHLARRVWWTIVHLNFRCARLLGHPIGVQLAETTCTLPLADEFTHHSRVVTLTRVTLAVTEALSRHPSNINGDRTVQIKARASALAEEVHQLQEWCNQQLRPALQRPLQLDSRGAQDWIHLAADASPSELLRGVLLELQYYDEMIGLHRSFISFPKRLLNPLRIPEADTHAATSLHHALAAVDLTHRVMSITDILHGRSEVYQWQWNALLTLIGFLMAYPFCLYAPNARRHAQLSLEIFSAADPKNMIASRAAAVTRALCAKVDSLVEILRSEGHRDATPSTESQHTSQLDDPGAPTDLSHPTSDELWSWIDMTDPDVWSAYSDGITGVLADFPDLPFGNDGFSSLP